MTDREAAEFYREASAKRDLVSRMLDTDSNPPIHVLEKTGEDPPAVLIHGGGTAAHAWLPLIDRLVGRHLVVPDRPGFGLSAPVGYHTAEFVNTAIRFLDTALDALEIDRADLVGNSMGGTWSLWYALARPERVRRLVLPGAAPLLPGTRIPGPLRLMAVPGLGGALSRMMKPSPRTVRQIMSGFGEGDTIIDHPEVVDAMVADNRDPVTSAAGLEETRAAITPIRGFRPSLRITEEDLGRVVAPTLLIWGSHDPVGGSDVARRTADALPDARLEILASGHLPWLGHPRRVADLIEGFLRSGH